MDLPPDLAPTPRQYLHVGDAKQDICYMVIPRSKSDKLIINLPRIIHLAVDEWINSKLPKRIFLQDGDQKFTIYDASVKVDSVINNRYGAPSHNLIIEFTNMSRGIIKEKLK